MPRDYAPTEVAESPEVAATRTIEKRAQADRGNGETAYQTIFYMNHPDPKERRPGPVIMIGGYTWDLLTEDGKTRRPVQNPADYLTSYRQMVAFYREDAEEHPDTMGLQELHRAKGNEVFCYTETGQPIPASDLSPEQAGPLLNDMNFGTNRASFNARQIEHCKASLRGFARAALRSGDVKTMYAVHQELAEPIDAKTVAEALRKIGLAIDQIDHAPPTVHDSVKAGRLAKKKELEYLRGVFQRLAEPRT